MVLYKQEFAGGPLDPVEELNAVRIYLKLKERGLSLQEIQFILGDPLAKKLLELSEFVV